MPKPPPPVDELVCAASKKPARPTTNASRTLPCYPPPEHLIRFFPINGAPPVETLITQARASNIHNIIAGTDDRLLVVIGPCSIHDPDGRARLRPPPEAEQREEIRRHAGNRDACLLRKAAHHRRLEGADQRPLPRRNLSHRRRPAHRAPAADRHQPASTCRPAASSST